MESTGVNITEDFHSGISYNLLQNSCYLLGVNGTKADILQCLNDAKAIHYIPAIVYLVFLLVIGSVGNIMVGYVYYFRLKKGSSHFFILCLVFLDLTNCLIGMPAEIVDLLFPFRFDSPVICKVLRFVESVVGITSAVILIQVAFARYYKICKPLQTFPLRRTSILAFGAFTCGLSLSWPALLIFGKKTIILPGGLHGCDCSTDDGMKGSVYIVLYYTCLICVFVLSVSILTVLYVLIGMRLWKKRKLTVIETKPYQATEVISPNTVDDSPRSSTSSSYETLPEPASPNSFLNFFSRKQSLSRKISSTSVTAIIPRHKHEEESRRQSSDTVISVRSARPTIKTGKMTVILFSVTIAFILSFLPYLTIMICRALDTYCGTFYSHGGEVVYKIASKSFFINNAANPIIYSFLSVRFRKECLNTFRELRMTFTRFKYCRISTE